MQKHRTWFPFILTGLTFMLALVIATQYVADEPSSDSLQENVSSEPILDLPRVTEEQYRKEVAEALTAYSSKAISAEQTYDTLLNMRVPAEMKQMHLELVIAFDAFKVGSESEGRARLDLLKQEETWLP